MKDKKIISKALKHPGTMGAGKNKIKTVMEEFHRGKLHSGSGALVHDPAQAAAIGYSEARKRGAKLPRKRK